MRALVTGGNGNIGSQLVPVLLEGDFDHVVVFDKDVSDAFLGNPLVTVVIGDICDQQALASAMQGCQAVIHMASVVWYRTNPPIDVIQQVNVQGTACVIAACHANKVKSLLYVGTIEAIYSTSGESHVDLAEDAIALPTAFLAGPYGASKAAAETLVLQANGKHGLTTVVARTGHVVGPGDRDHIDPMYAAATALGFMPVFSSSRSTQQLIHVEDCVGAIVILLRKIKQIAGRHVSVAGDPDLGWRKSLLEDWSQPHWQLHYRAVPLIRIPFRIALFLAWLVELAAWALRLVTFGLVQVHTPFTRTAVHGTGQTCTYNIDLLKSLGFKFKHSFAAALTHSLQSWRPAETAKYEKVLQIQKQT